MHSEGYRVTTEHEASHWWFRARRELFLAQVRLAADELGFPAERLRLLDYGCGSGFNLAYLSEFGEAIGADVASRPFDGHRNATGRSFLDLEGDLAAQRGRFQIVTALDVLEHLDDDSAGLREMARLLSPDGQIVATVPAYRWLWSGEDVISQHRRRYTRRTLDAACRRAGLKVVWLSYFNLSVLPLMAVLVWARRLIFSRSAPRSNLEVRVGWLNRVALALCSREARWVGNQRVRLPAGASLVCRLVSAESDRA